MEETIEETTEQINRTSRTGLQPCPFCASVTLSLITYQGNMPVTIQCDDCGATGPLGDTEETNENKRSELLRTLWDTRRSQI